MIKKLLTFTLLFGCLSLKAGGYFYLEAPFVNYNSEINKEATKISLYNTPVNPIWNYTGEEKTDSFWGLDYDQSTFKPVANSDSYRLKSIGLHYSKYFSKKHFVSLMPFYSSLEVSKQTKEFSHLNLRYYFKASFGDIDFVHEKQFLGNTSPRNSAFTKFLNYQSNKISFYRYLNTYRLRSSIDIRSISDNNKRSQLITNLMFPAFKKTFPWLWYGINWEHLEHKTESADYWSPRRLSALSLQSEISQSLFNSDRWKINAFAGYGKSKENDLDLVDAKSYGVALLYGDRNAFQFIISHSNFDSKTWKEKTNKLSIQHFF